MKKRLPKNTRSFPYKKPRINEKNTPIEKGLLETEFTWICVMFLLNLSRVAKILRSWKCRDGQGSDLAQVQLDFKPRFLN